MKKTKVIQSKQYTIDWRDAGRATLTAMITAVLPILFIQITSWMNVAEYVIDWKLLGGSALLAGISHLILNYFTPSKVIVTGADEPVSETAGKIKQVI